MAGVTSLIRFVAFRFFSIAPYAILLASMFWEANSTVAAPSSYPAGNETAEQYYWRKVHRQESAREKLEEEQRREIREQVKEMLPELLQDGAAVQRDIILAETGPVAPPPSSVFEGKRDYIFLGFIAVLVVVLVTSTLVRYRREAEIRLLAGTYLADGKDTARMKMPELFGLPSAWPTAGISASATEAERFSKQVDALPAVAGPAAEFFAQAPGQLAGIRKRLSEFGKAFDDTERQQRLLELHELIGVLKNQAKCWELRPAWQMSSALESLLHLLLDKGKEITPSTLRTVASAVDVLGEVCVPGVRPDLVITPPISVLAVDDNPLCLRAVVFALEKAGLTPDVAESGERAVTLAAAKAYDVIFMDIQMPGIDGLTASLQIRVTEKNQSTPIIFVTARSDFQTRAQSSTLGDTDLIAKPFLQFEITVKALTFAMRKRLKLAASLERTTMLMLANRSEKRAA